MKTLKITLLLSLLCSAGYSQIIKFEQLIAYYSPIEDGSLSEIKRELFFNIRGAYVHPVTKTKLTFAGKLEDISMGYPTNWIADYISVEIISTCNGKSMHATSRNSILTPEQKSILKNVDLGAQVQIIVKYRSTNSANDKIEIRSMSLGITVIPETEAYFPGGSGKMKMYLQENAINKIPKSIYSELRQTMLNFTVNEFGEIINAKITQSTGDPQTDQLLMEALYKMPKWIPAENSKAMKVKQEFEFVLANDGC